MMKQAIHTLNVLIIDDDPIVRNMVQSNLKDKLNVFVAAKPSIGFQLLSQKQIDLVLMDFKMPEMNGLQMLEKVKSEYTDIEVIMISSSDDMDTVIGALRKGAADYCRKPFSSSQLWLAIERTRKYSVLQAGYKREVKKNKLLKAEVDRQVGYEIIGSSAAIENIQKQMQLVAQTPDTSVLLIGESGTGKELIARGIHQLSSRKEELFGAVNMSAVPETLFESEFFGHKKGSFTGAITDKAGWFESANKGTLFFDEIGEMGMALQVKLLRVLEDRKYTRLGTQQHQQFDIRIVAATNKPVEVLTDGQSFRLDLFHRIGTFIIQIPPLRERKEDIPLLVDYFLKALCEKMGKKISRVNAEATQLLMNYSFPGNIRELKNMVERAIIMCPDSELLPAHFSLLAPTGTNQQENEPAAAIYDLKELEKRTIEQALVKVKYNKAEAARLLNIEWNALYRRMQKYNILLPGEVE
ncbi:MAG: sigma-54-dependent Fis family transcriptional regulator [Marinilabiliaceae bacterium]|nr:sigma-54-dependent Fis family transcriptional regulator [Marinilabiliaceae bacterium]